MGREWNKMKQDETMYGRRWGARDHVPRVHERKELNPIIEIILFAEAIHAREG